MQETAGRVVDTVQDTARPVVDKASETAGQVTEQVTEQVTSRLDMAVDYAADTLTGVAQALRQTGQHLREEGAQPTLGRYADSGAQQVEQLSGYLRQRDATELLSDVETYARRNPMTFAGGAFALGLLAARFFRASGQRPHAPPMRTGSSYRAPAAMPAPRPSAPPPPPRPNFNAANPPGYASAAPAARNIPPSPGATTPTPGSAPAGTGASTLGREAERLTPTPGSQSTVGGTGAPGAGRAPASGASPSTGGTPSPGAAPGSDRPGTGGQRQV